MLLEVQEEQELCSLSQGPLLCMLQVEGVVLLNVQPELQEEVQSSADHLLK